MKYWSAYVGLLVLPGVLAGSALAQDNNNLPPIPMALPKTSIPLAPQNTTPDQNAQAAAQPIKFRVYAFMARKADAESFPPDEDCKTVLPLLKKLPLNYFERVAVVDRDAMPGAETQFPINPIYTLNLKMNGVDAQQNALLDIQVQQFQNGIDPVNALKARAQARGGDMLLMRGMPLPPGELVLVLARDPDSQQNQSSKDGRDQKEDQQDQQQQDQKEDQQKQDQQSSEDKDKQQQQEDKEKQEQQEKKEQAQAQKQQEGEKEQQQPKTEGEEKMDQQQESSPQDAAEGEQPQDPKNLQAVLESLEETDRREQRDLRNVRDRIDFQGDWW